MIIDDVKDSLRSINISDRNINNLDTHKFSDIQLMYLDGIIHELQIKSSDKFRLFVFNFIKRYPLLSCVIYILFQILPILMYWGIMQLTQMYMDKDDMIKIGDALQQFCITMMMAVPMIGIAFVFPPSYKLVASIFEIGIDLLKAIKDFAVYCSGLRITHANNNK